MGLTTDQIINIKNWANDLWALLDQDDYNKIAEIYGNAVEREGKQIYRVCLRGIT